MYRLIGIVMCMRIYTCERYKWDHTLLYGVSSCSAPRPQMAAHDDTSRETEVESSEDQPRTLPTLGTTIELHNMVQRYQADLAHLLMVVMWAYGSARVWVHAVSKLIHFVVIWAYVQLYLPLTIVVAISLTTELLQFFFEFIIAPRVDFLLASTMRYLLLCEQARTLTSGLVRASRDHEAGEPVSECSVRALGIALCHAEFLSSLELPTERVPLYRYLHVIMKKRKGFDGTKTDPNLNILQMYTVNVDP